jgi:hypothetical protein
MERSWDIYALLDPRTDAVRYVGWSFNAKRRLKNHLKVDGKHTHKANWIRSLLALGLKPQLKILETGTGNWADQERWWIAKSRFYGADLTNDTDGGEGTVGHRPTEEWKRQHSAFMIGKQYSKDSKRTQEWKDQSSLRLLGNQHSKGCIHTKEQNAQQSVFMKGNQCAKGATYKRTEEDKANKRAAWVIRKAKKNEYTITL